MSSPTTAAVATAVTVADAVEKPPRKFPPPCWTQEETLGLIAAYRERWYALRRGYLRTPDWEAVATAVASLYPDASPAKTSAQCRHKMEKLRQRYRAEKQRVLSFPHPAGRYLSPWFFFESMEAMENGTTPPTAVQKPENSADGSGLKSFLDQNTMKLKLKAKIDADSSPDSGFDKGVKWKRNNFFQTKISTADQKEEQEYTPLDEDPFHLGRRQSMNSRTPNNFNHIGGFHQQFHPVKKFQRHNTSANGLINRFVDHNSLVQDFIGGATMYWENSNSMADCRATTNGLKRRRNAVEEMADSIKMLGEEFLKMEKQKMEMAREMEAMRIEMEMKRNEMLLESQKQVVDAVVKGFLELKKKSKKVKNGTACGVTADSAE